MELKQQNIWETWDGKRIKGTYKEEFIQTKDNEWSIRYNIWMKNLDNGCPAPMPYGHIMFK